MFIEIPEARSKIVTCILMYEYLIDKIIKLTQTSRVWINLERYSIKLLIKIVLHYSVEVVAMTTITTMTQGFSMSLLTLRNGCSASNCAINHTVWNVCQVVYSSGRTKHVCIKHRFVQPAPLSDDNDSLCSLATNSYFLPQLLRATFCLAEQLIYK